MANHPNILFIVLDTVREDSSNEIYKVLENFGFIKYDNVIAPSPWTFPSHASMFTGVYPAFHGAHETRDEKGFGIRLKYSNLLTHELSSQGYRTYLFTANPYIRPHFGFRGFEYFYEVVGWKLQISLLSYEEISAIETLKKEMGIDTNKLVDLVRLSFFLFQKNPKLFFKGGVNKLLSGINPIYSRIIAKKKNWPLDKGSIQLLNNFKKTVDVSKPFFAFFNFLEAHEPYFPGDAGEGVRQSILYGGADELYIRRWRKTYPKEVRYLSKRLLEFMELLQDLNSFENSLIIVTSDHGQLLGEDNKLGHGYGVYDEVLRVPLFIKYPSSVRLTSRHSQNDDDTEYVSLIKLRELVINLSKPQSVFDDSILYSKTVFSESYGIGGITVSPKTEEEASNVQILEKYRIAIYHKGLKGVFNVTDWKFEEIRPCDPKLDVTDEIITKLKKQVVNFLSIASAVKASKKKIFKKTSLVVS